MTTVTCSPLSPRAESICKKRYYKKDDDGNCIEDWEGLVDRAVSFVCCKENEERQRKDVKKLMMELKFVPNSPCLANAGSSSKSKGLLACFVSRPTDDSWSSMKDTIGLFGDVARQGGGVGMDFSLIRPENDPVFGSTHAKACGPIAHMIQLSSAMGTITQSAFRGMALLGTVRVDHPDIFKFIHAKSMEKALKTLLGEDFHGKFDDFKNNPSDQLRVLCDKFMANFNLSVMVNDTFMEKVEEDGEIELIFDGKVYKTVKAQDIFNDIVDHAWKTGDPGLLFYDRINDSPYKFSGQKITATNPCIVGSTLVLTEDGPKPIKEMIGKRTKILSYIPQTDPLLLDSGYRYIWTFTDGAFRTKRNAEVISVHTKRTKITCTPDHKILTVSGWKEGKDLRSGELILCNPCGLGVSYELEHPCGEKWSGFGAEVQRMANESFGIGEAAQRVVPKWIRTEEDQFYDLNYWLDLQFIEKVFYQRETASTWKKCGHRQDEATTIRECCRREEPVLSVDGQTGHGSKDQAVQLRLVSISDCGEGLFAEFLRVDNGDVLGLPIQKLDDGGQRLSPAKWRNLQTRLFHLYTRWNFRENHRSQKQMDFGTKGIQSRSISEGVQCSDRGCVRYIAIRADSSEIYYYNSAQMEEVVRITEEEPQDVFDLTTDHNTHNFIANGIVVHNCGEQPLPPWASCNLGTIDVSKFFDQEQRDLDWSSLKKAIRIAVQFLDDVIDVNTFPTNDFKKWAKDNRPVGLGIMGWADLLIKMRMAYGSSASIEFANRLSDFFLTEAHKKSVELGKDRGVPKCCRHEELGHRRNITLLTVAPTGTGSQLANCANAIEPIFSPVTVRYDNTGSHKAIHEKADKNYFRCAIDPENKGREVGWKQHVEMQATFQKYIDSGISKTINMPSSATKEDVAEAMKFAWKSGCKGVTVFRDRCKSEQVLNTMEKKVVSKIVEDRPKELPCDIFKRTSMDFEWHFIVGKYNDRPYEVFALNGKSELPKTGTVVRKKAKHYALLDDDRNVLVENIVEQEKDINPAVAHETRRFSMELRNGISASEIVEQIDKVQNDHLFSFSKIAARIFKQEYLSDQEIAVLAASKTCDLCAKNGETVALIPGPGRCFECPQCGNSKCG